MRGIDVAGNTGDSTSITLIVNNGPPVVSITDRWWIWETGQLRVSPNHFPIASVKVTIRDPQNRCPAVVINLKPGKTSFPISWNRRFADRTLAPSGEYLVSAVACDVNGLCGRDTGTIVIPMVAASTATMTATPRATTTFTPSPTSTALQISSAPTSVLLTPIPEEIPEPIQSSYPLWPIIGLLGLFVAIASASVVDPRPKALERLGETQKFLSTCSKDVLSATNNNNKKGRI